MFFFIEGDSPENKPAFESIKHINEYGEEYWTARELQAALTYKEWRKFNGIIQKAMEACKASNNEVSDHFVQVDKIVEAGITTKEIEDYNLSRCACYLIAMNGDAQKGNSLLISGVDNSAFIIKQIFDNVSNNLKEKAAQQITGKI